MSFGGLAKRARNTLKRRLPMQLENRIEQLIRTASNHLANDVDRDGCRTVSKEALKCVEALVGSDHPYTNLLKDTEDESERTGLLTACGVLWAAKLLVENEIQSETTGRKDSAGSWRELSGYLS
jgi:hypothetical protein